MARIETEYGEEFTLDECWMAAFEQLNEEKLETEHARHLAADIMTDARANSNYNWRVISYGEV